jgi:hypothetical protein
MQSMLSAVLAHIAGVPVEESLIYLLPPILVVLWIYAQGWRERRNPQLAARRRREAEEVERRLDEEDELYGP